MRLKPFFGGHTHTHTLDVNVVLPGEAFKVMVRWYTTCHERGQNNEKSGEFAYFTIHYDRVAFTMRNTSGQSPIASSHRPDGIMDKGFARATLYLQRYG